MASNRRDRYDPDFYLWLNDDVVLSPHALQTLLATQRWAVSTYGRQGVIVGAVADPNTGRLTYGGYKRVSRWRRFRFDLLAERPTAQACDTMNGNVVLISRDATQAIGELDPSFEHGMGDTDYALRAIAAGVPVAVAPGVVGYCTRNTTSGTHLDPSLPFQTRWRHYLGRKGLPPKSWARLTRRHGGWFWFAYFLSPYISFLKNMISQTARTPGSDRRAKN